MKTFEIENAELKSLSINEMGGTDGGYKPIVEWIKDWIKDLLQ